RKPSAIRNSHEIFYSQHRSETERGSPQTREIIVTANTTYSPLQQATPRPFSSDGRAFFRRGESLLTACKGNYTRIRGIYGKSMVLACCWVSHPRICSVITIKGYRYRDNWIHSIFPSERRHGVSTSSRSHKTTFSRAITNFLTSRQSS